MLSFVPLIYTPLPHPFELATEVVVSMWGIAVVHAAFAVPMSQSTSWFRFQSRHTSARAVFRHTAHSSNASRTWITGAASSECPTRTLMNNIFGFEP